MIFSFAKEKSTGAKVYNLGSGTSIDVSHIDGFEELTADNFLIVPSKGVTGWYGECMTSEYSANDFSYSASGTLSLPTLSYNNTTGVLTVTPAKVVAQLGRHGGGAYIVASKTINVSHNIYLIIGEIG